jgi:hypothetical protein
LGIVQESFWASDGGFYGAILTSLDRKKPHRGDDVLMRWMTWEVIPPRPHFFNRISQNTPKKNILHVVIKLFPCSHFEKNAPKTKNSDSSLSRVFQRRF